MSPENRLGLPTCIPQINLQFANESVLVYDDSSLAARATRCRITQTRTAYAHPGNPISCPSQTIRCDLVLFRSLMSQLQYEKGKAI